MKSTKSTDTLELPICDQTEPCPYLPGRTARLPLRWPLSRLSGVQFDRCLETGDRRSGRYLYRPQCYQCQACQPIRLDVAQFETRRTQRRVQRQGDRRLSVETGAPVIDEQRVALFNRHRRERDLSQGEADLTLQEYQSFLVDSCCETLEIRYYREQQLVGVGICDRGEAALSAVYFFFDTEFSYLSPGVYSVLTQVELCRQWDLRYLYLGYYVADSRHMAYKADYRPHQRLINGHWQDYE